uniref:Uncharacterized protein n=1 Tax=Anguilla anguilla TaxID=7936 RepID=A0A0E9TFR0_ANGAN
MPPQNLQPFQGKKSGEVKYVINCFIESIK